MSRGREGAQVEMPHVEKGLGATVGPQLLLAVRQNPGSERLGQELPAPWAAPPPWLLVEGKPQGPGRSWGDQAPRAK